MPRSLKQVVHVLASVRLAVVTMAALGVACVAATFYEASHGTAAAQRAFYHSTWFALLLGMLAVSMALSALERYPWNRHQVGFVLAHAGVLLLLLGSVVSMYAGLDGRLALAEGETSDRLALAGESMQVDWSDGTRTSVPVDFSLHPPAPGTRFALAGGGTLVVEEFAPSARVVRTGARLVLLNVVEGSLLTGEREAIRQARVRLADSVHACRSSGCDPETAVTVGSAAGEIARVATERSAGVVVMGVQGARTLHRLFCGSTAHRVIRESSCPVLAVRQT
jgi:nucleotide-binding universal stress UspA family protein